ncbi:PucR family transcriptional regulator [Patulibacter defluvii]|uniref:PucR family transcriptional regulator n=1 Tax=Patulibacter defluvii TaxID=3095358 RepID=UPI002A765906|nr:PucR family transcriptional regulator [Patulibacter sp. DM4]
MSTGPFSLRDLLEHRELGLELLAGGPAASDRRVSGAHSIELAQPARWLAPDWVMLTSGLRLEDDEPAQRQLVRELHRHSAAALGFGTELVFDEVPPAIVDEARELGFPVFRVPLTTPFRELIAFVHRSLLSSEMRTLQRLSSIQRYLIDALRTPEPQPVLVERLATLLDGSAAIVEPGGHVLHASGALPDDLSEALFDPAAGVREWRLGAWSVVAAPLDADDAGWVVLASRTRTLAPRLSRAAVQATVPLVAAAARLEETVRQQDRAVRRSLLAELLQLEAKDAGALAARAAALGVDLAVSHRAIVVRAEDDADEAALDAVEALVEARRGVGLVSVDRGRVVVVLAGEPTAPSGITRQDDEAGALPAPAPVLREDDPAERLVADLLEADARIAVGLGRAFKAPSGVAASVADAHVAVELVTRGDERRWRRFDDLDLTETVLAHVDRQAIGPKLAALAEILDSRPGLRAAIRAWFDAELDVRAAADALHLHPNSLRYRLGRLAEALDRPLRAPSTIADLHLLLEAERRHALDPEE